MPGAASPQPKYENPLFEKTNGKKGGTSYKKYVWIGLGVLLLLFVSSLIILRNPSSYITLAIISGNSRHSSEEITQVINSTLQGSRFLVYPKKNIYISPLDEVAKQLQNTFYYSEVHIDRIYSQHAIHVSVVEQPLEFVLSYGETIRYVTQDGTLLERITRDELESAQAAFMQIIVPESLIQRDEEFEKEFITTEIITEVETIARAFQSPFENDLLAIEYTSDAGQDVKIHTKDGWYVYLDASQAIEQQINTAYTVFINNIKGKSEEASLEYIDVRVDSRAYFK